MHSHHPNLSERLLPLLAGVLILKVTASVISNYGSYFPPDFRSDFLRGREAHFFGVYQWAFYTHILSGPVSLIMGLILIGERFRARFPKWHRYLGRDFVGCVLLLVAPSGLWMARYAAAGPVAAVGLAALAIATATCVVTRRMVGHDAAVCRSSSLDVALLSFVVFGRRAQTDRRAGNSHGSVRPVARSARELDELAGASAGLSNSTTGSPLVAADFSLPEIDIRAWRTFAEMLDFRNLTLPSTSRAFMPPA